MPNISECEKFKAIVDSIRAGANEVWVRGLWDSSRAYFISAVFQEMGLPCVVVESGDDERELLYHELETFLPEVEIQLFPAREVYSHSYRDVGVYRGLIEEQRTTTLAKLVFGDVLPVIVTSIQALLQKVPSPEPLLSSTLKVSRGKAISMERVVKYLHGHDYERVAEVSRTGEFSLRGGILDIFSPHEESPVRIEFSGETIESIRKFDAGTQRSTERKDDCSLFPVDGLVEENPSTLLAYIPQETIIFLDEPVLIRKKAKEVTSIATEIEESSLRVPARGADRPGGASDYIAYEKLVREYRQYTVVYLSLLPQETSEMRPEKIHQLRTFSTECKSCRFDYVADKVRAWMKEEFTIVFYCNNDGEKKRLMELLADYGVELDGNVDFRIGHLRGGFVFPDIRLVFLSDQEIFGRYRRRTIRRIRGLPLERESELTTGDYVVHIDHGVGKYLGLEKLEADGRMGEFLAIEYLGGDRLYIPPSHIHLIEKYVGIEGKPPPVYRLGGSSWNLAKVRAARAIRDMAGELLELYATRELSEGFKFSSDTPWQYEFESAFIYEETPDQLKTVDAIKADMESPKSMDRLVCGDSGYGKTEVAVRAAFKAVMDGKQVAVLVPTTILAEQHYTVFSERMADYPINVAVLSRFKTAVEQKKIIAGLKGATIDIVIGTHRLLQDDICFHDLALVIVDEEQRFGVAQKEKLKKLKRTVDVLAMSATPIPRTLYMSLMGIRDISIINTPPENRFPVEGYLIPFDKKLLRKAILREIERDGQVFYVYNRVERIERVKDMLEELIPEARIEIGHGQMPAKELERVMADFLAVRIDVLVCTTIIESGLDIPNANTIIISNAPAFGLADLYQLRGRVGRYKHKAYAFFIIPDLNPVTPEAKKRLSAIEELTGAGAGFRVAMRDLEIRGAGNLLGPQQHGDIVAIGFDLYCKLLRETIRELKGEKAEKFEPAFDLGVEFFIPDSFIPDAGGRIMVYRKMVKIVDLQGIDELKEELRDRFGKLPQEVFKLLKVLELKLKARESGIAYIGVDKDRIHIRLRSEESFTYQLQENTELLDAVEKLIDECEK